MSHNEIELVKYKSTFRWRTMDGQVLSLDDMKTGHIFNSFLKNDLKALPDR